MALQAENRMSLWIVHFYSINRENKTILDFS